MKRLVRPGRLGVVAQLAWSRALLAFDFDGTLAPIVRNPAFAAMRASSEALFRKTSRLFPTAVITGRSRAVVALFVGDDSTDEDVFRIDQPGRLSSVCVGWSATAAAAYSLRDQRKIDGLLRRPVLFRERATR